MPSTKMSLSLTRTLNAMLARTASFCVAPRDVQRGVGLRESQALGFFERPGVGPPVARHAGEDDVAGAVHDADEGIDAVGEEAAGEGVDDGDAAAGAGLEGDAGVVPAGER